MKEIAVIYGPMTDRELTEKLKALVAEERADLVRLLVHLGEFGVRRLYLDAGHPSLFSYCTKVLGYSEGAAYKRIYTARVCREFPGLLELLRGGRTHMAAVMVLGPHLTEANHGQMLKDASGKSRLEIERMAAHLAPELDRRDMIRRISATAVPEPASLALPSDLQAAVLPASDTASVPVLSPSPGPKDVLQPTAPERVRFAFSGSDELLNLLRRAQEVLKHKYPAGNLESIFLEALKALLDKKDPDRRIRAKEEKGKVISVDLVSAEDGRDSQSRRIPQAVRDAVWRRDEGQCVFVDPEGGRCPERGGLEFDHIVPFALGGASNNPKNLRLLCKAHNLMMARRAFGDGMMRYWRR